MPGYGNYLANGIWHHNTGKGWIALSVMIQLLTGKLPLGMAGRLIQRALYVDYETTKEEIEDRTSRLCEGMRIDAPGYDYHRGMLAITQEVGLLRRSMQKWDLVIWDSMGAGMGEHPNDPGVGASAMNALRTLESTVLFLDHTNKEGGLMASAYKRNLCRSLWTVSKRKGAPEDPMHLTLWDKKVNNAAARPPRAFLFTFDGEAGPVTVTPSEPAVAETTGRKRVYASDAERKSAWRGRQRDGQDEGDQEEVRLPYADG